MAIGDPPLAYQWYRDFAPIAGATAPGYRTPPAAPGDDGASFWCVVSSGTRSVVSSTAVLGVGDSASSYGGNILSNSGFEEGTDGWMFYTASSGGFNAAAPGYEGTQAGIVTIGDSASNIQLYQSGFALEAGERYRLSFHAYSTTERNLSVMVLQHSSPYANFGLPATEFDLTSSWNGYSVEFVASGFSGTTSDTRLRFWMAPYAQAGDRYYFDNVTIRKVASGDVPVITEHPVSQHAMIGETVEFTVAASGGPPLQYQWQRNEVDIPSATGPVFEVSSVALTDSGARFRCRVTNPSGTTTSATAMLHVRSLDPLSGDAVRVVVLGSSTAEGEAARPLSNAWANKYRAYLQSINPESQLINLAIGGFTTFNVMPDGYVGPSPWNTPAYAPVTKNNITHALDLRPTFIILNLPTNDCALYIPVSVQMQNYQHIVSEARSRNVPVWITSPQPRNMDQAGRSLLFELRDSTDAEYPGRVIDFWTDLADPQGFILPEYNYDNTHLNNAGHAILYQRVVNTVRWDPPVNPPVIIRDPQSQTVLEGDTVLFSVAVQGTAPLAFRWQRNGVDLAGAVDSVYRIPLAGMADSGALFRVLVTNTGGTDTSRSAVLHVLPVVPATITVDPADTVVVVGQSARFSVSATGSPPLAYRWQRNGVDIDGATDTVYVIASVTPADSGALFRAIVSNGGGSDTSQAAELRVMPAPLEGVALRVKVFLQGPSAGDTMSTALGKAGLIPLKQPYSGPPWNYAGVESVAVVPSGVVDWVLVELRSGEAESTKVATRAAFLKSDGVVTDLDGSGPVVFAGAAPGSFYLVIEHRNHLSAMSVAAVALSSASPQYDFTTGPGQYYGGEAAPLGAGGYGLWAGDVDASGDVAAGDRNAAWNNRNLAGYLMSDVDLTGDVAATDRNITWNNRNRSSRVPR